MTGHEPIVTMRRDGNAPRCVWVTRHLNQLANFPMVFIADGDIPELLDLRFLVGLTALVEGPDDDPIVPRLASACAKFARRTVCSLGHYVQPYGYETTKITDTSGIMVWPN